MESLSVNLPESLCMLAPPETTGPGSVWAEWHTNGQEVREQVLIISGEDLRSPLTSFS